MQKKTPPPDLLRKRRPSTHSPCFSEMLTAIGIFENDEQGTSSRPSPEEKAIKTQLKLIGDTDNIGPFENAEQGYKVDVVDMKFGSVM